MLTRIMIGLSYERYYADIPIDLSTTFFLLKYVSFSLRRVCKILRSQSQS